MSAQPNLRIVQSGDGEIEGELPALIPPGKYQLRLTHWTTYKFMGKAPKLALCFSVIQQGQYFEALLKRHYNVVRLVGKEGRSGRFKASPGGDLVRDYARLLQLPSRFDRFDLQQLKSHVILGLVDTVTTTARQKALAPAVQYSVVRELLNLEA